MWNLLSIFVSIQFLRIKDFSHLKRLPRGQFFDKIQTNIVDVKMAERFFLVFGCDEMRCWDDLSGNCWREKKKTAARQRWNSHNVMIIVIYDGTFVVVNIQSHTKPAASGFFSWIYTATWSKKMKRKEGENEFSSAHLATAERSACLWRWPWASLALSRALIRFFFMRFSTYILACDQAVPTLYCDRVENNILAFLI